MLVGWIGGNMSVGYSSLNYLYTFCGNNYKHKKIFKSTDSIQEIVAKKTKIKPSFLKLLSSEDLQYIIDFLLDDEEQLEIFVQGVIRKLRNRYKKRLLQRLDDEELEQKLNSCYLNLAKRGEFTVA